jgi:DNA-binding beta-propeller fold protein YncE
MKGYKFKQIKKMKKLLPLSFLFAAIAANINAQAPAISYSSPQTYTAGMAITPLTPTNTGGAVPATVSEVVTTLAGSTTPGSTNATGTAASFNLPTGVAVDATGNTYVADFSNDMIRKITPAGVVTTLAGSGTAGSTNGTGTTASFWSPQGVAVDASGNVYVADKGNNMIRKITPAGVVTTLATSFNWPAGVAVDASGNVYVADRSNNMIREITPAGVVTTLAGSGTAGSTNGTGTAASFYSPFGVAVDATGNVYVAEWGNNMIRKITPAGVVTTLATGFNLPTGVAVDATGNVYVANQNSNMISKITPAGVVTTLAGSGTAGSTNGTGTTASFNGPSGVAVDASGNVYVADANNNMIRKITQTGYSISPALPAGLSFDATTGTISGTPTTVSAATTYTITATNIFGSATATVSITVKSAPVPVISYSSPQTYMAGTTITPLTPTNTGGAVPATIPGVTTLAGSGTQGSTNATGTAASFYFPVGVAVDASGNVYVADFSNDMIRKITPAGVVTTLAGSTTCTWGSANGISTNASFNGPNGVTVDASGNVYVADYFNNMIRKITPAGVVTTLAGSTTSGSTDGTGTAAGFNGPRGVAVDATGNVYVADYSNNMIRKITPVGVVTTLAAGFNGPTGVAVDNFGNVYVADDGNNVIRKITPAGVVTTLAGSTTLGSTNATGTAASFEYPYGVAVDASGNVYVADQGNNMIRKITPAGVVTTLAGSTTSGSANGTGTAAGFYKPLGVAFDVTTGNVYVADDGNNMIRKITQTGYSISPALPAGLSFDATTGIISGTPTAASAATTYTITATNTGGSATTTVSITVNAPVPVISYSSPQTYMAGTTITPLSPTNTGGAVPATIPGTVTTLAGSTTLGSTNATGTAASFEYPFGVAVDATGNVYVADFSNDMIRKITPAGVVTTLAAGFNGPTGVAVDASGNVYVADKTNNMIRKITPAGVVTTLAGSTASGSTDGTGTAAGFNGPTGVAVDVSGNVYVADYSNNMIRKITPAGVVTTLAAGFNGPTGVAVDASGNVYVADKGNNMIRKITPAGVVTTLAGSTTLGSTNATGTAASFEYPYGVAVDASGNVYVADWGNNMIRKITPAGVVTTLAGSTTSGSANGTGTAASFYYPSGVAVDASGNVYVADAWNNMIRKITQTGYSISPALPAGLSFDATTGIISGTPTAASAATTYTITATNIFGSATATVSIAVSAITTGVQTATTGSVTIYPNPVTDGFHITGLSGTYTLSILDLNGRTLTTKILTGDEYVSIGSLPKGLYIVKLITAEGTVERKILKK